MRIKFAKIYISISLDFSALSLSSKKKSWIIFGERPPMETQQDSFDASLQRRKAQTDVWNHERMHRPLTGQPEQKDEKLQISGHLRVSTRNYQNSQFSSYLAHSWKYLSAAMH